MERPKIIPVLNECVLIEKLANDEYILTQEKLQFRVRINEMTYRLMLLVNGERNCLQISNAYNQLFDDKTTEAIVETVLAHKLGRFGIFKNDDIEAKEKTKPNYLKLSTIFLQAHQYEKITRAFAFLFRPHWMVVTTITALMLVVLTLISHFTGFKAYVSGGQAFPVLMFIVVFMLSGVLHELGHASACKHFNAYHGGMGFGFYLLSPVLFVDVSNIWRLSPRKRVVVNLGGIYFELLFCALLILAGVLNGDVDLQLIAVLIFAKTLFNLNPFFRTDGYWVLSDAINVPNLRAESTSRFIHVFKKTEQPFSRKDWWLAAYGSVSFVIIGGFLAYILIVQPTSIVTFPNDVIKLATEVIKNGITSQDLFSALQKLLLPVFFYVLLIRFLVKWVQKRFTRV